MGHDVRAFWRAYRRIADVRARVDGLPGPRRAAALRVLAAAGSAALEGGALPPAGDEGLEPLAHELASAVEAAVRAVEGEAAGGEVEGSETDRVVDRGFLRDAVAALDAGSR